MGSGGPEDGDDIDSRVEHHPPIASEVDISTAATISDDGGDDGRDGGGPR
ncbi:MAG: hypothetical protein WKF93_09925 [Acidimicrobiales bacterium]